MTTASFRIHSKNASLYLIGFCTKTKLIYLRWQSEPGPVLGAWAIMLEADGGGAMVLVAGCGDGASGAGILGYNYRIVL